MIRGLSLWWHSQRAHIESLLWMSSWQSCWNTVNVKKQRLTLYCRLQKEVVILGGAFHANGNVNPAAEANILGDPDAADYVMEQGTKLKLISLDVTHRVEFTSNDMNKLRGKGKFGTFIADISKFYIDYYRYALSCQLLCVSLPQR